MLVSVVIPAFNAADWISETIRSVLYQTYGDLEIIVIDDGSSDGTALIAEDVLRSGRCPYQVMRQNNIGVSATRNRGWRLAKGEWVQFLDADDLLHPRKIEWQISQIHVNPSVDVVYSDWQKLVLRSGIWKYEDHIREPYIGEDALADIIKDENFQQLGSQLFSVKVLERVGGFDHSHSFVEDVELCIKIGLGNGVFAKAPSTGPASWYRDRPGSLSKSSQSQHVEACIRNAKLVEAQIRGGGAADSKTIDAIVDVYYCSARYFVDHNWMRFEQIVQDIDELQPGFLPKGPLRMKVLSRIAGYRRAEQLAVLYRRWKGLAASLVRFG
jgi:glycosyltransferase involved in cell wall biosynthesis